MATCAADFPCKGTFGFSAEPVDDESLPGFIMRVACKSAWKSVLAYGVISVETGPTPGM